MKIFNLILCLFIWMGCITGIAGQQTRESRVQSELNYSEQDRGEEGLQNVREYCRRIARYGPSHQEEDCYKMYPFIKYIEPELMAVCDDMFSGSGGYGTVTDCWNYIANKVYTQEEREECMDMATEYLDVRRAAWGTTRNVQYLNTKVISCLRSKGAYIHPTITLSSEASDNCSQRLRNTFNWMFPDSVWFENSFGKYPIGGNCNIYGCTSSRGICKAWGCPISNNHCYASGQGCRQGPRKMCN